MKFFQIFFSIAIMILSNYVYAADRKPKIVQVSIEQSRLDLRGVLNQYTGRMMRGGQYPGKIQDMLAVFAVIADKDEAAKQTVLRGLLDKVIECNKDPLLKKDQAAAKA